MGLPKIDRAFSSCKNVNDLYEKIEVKIPLLGGRRYSIKGYQGTINFDTLLVKAEIFFSSKKIENSAHSEKLINRLKKLNDLGNEKLKLRFFLIRWMTSLRQIIGNWKKPSKEQRFKTLNDYHQKVKAKEFEESFKKVPLAIEHVSEEVLKNQSEEFDKNLNSFLKKPINEKQIKDLLNGIIGNKTYSMDVCHDSIKKNREIFIDLIKKSPQNIRNTFFEELKKPLFKDIYREILARLLKEKPETLDNLTELKVLNPSSNQFFISILKDLQIELNKFINMDSNAKDFNSNHQKNWIYNALTSLVQKYWDIESSTSTKVEKGCVERREAIITVIQQTIKAIVAKGWSHRLIAICLSQVLIRSSKNIFANENFSFKNNPTAELDYFDNVSKMYKKIITILFNCLSSEKEAVENEFNLNICFSRYENDLFSAIYIFESRLWEKNLKDTNPSKTLFTLEKAIQSIPYSDEIFGVIEKRKLVPGYFLKHFINDPVLVQKILHIKGKNNCATGIYTSEHHDAQWIYNVFEVFDPTLREQFFHGIKEQRDVEGVIIGLKLK